MISNENTTGGRIRELREKKGETQADMAKNLYVLRETVNQWENDVRDLKTEYTIKLADYFGVTCDYILRGVQAENVDIHKQTGLSEKALNVLKFQYNHDPYIKTDRYVKIVNLLLEQDAPDPYKYAGHIPDNMSEEDWYDILDREHKNWSEENRIPIISMIADYFRQDDKSPYDLGVIVPRIQNNMPFATALGNDIINFIYLPEIQERLKKLKERYTEGGK